MPDNPISNPGVNPTDPVRLDTHKPGPGADDAQGRPFSLSPDAGKANAASPASNRPTPMEVAGDASRQPQTIPQEELSGQVNRLKDQLGTIHQQLQDSSLTQKFSADHYDALQRVTQKMNPDMQTIAKNSQGTFEPPQQKSGQSVLDFVSHWINGAQGTLGGALDYLQNTKKPDIASYLKLQYAVQRATQRGELFASIVGSSVSGIKTIMSTQLG